MPPLWKMGNGRMLGILLMFCAFEIPSNVNSQNVRDNSYFDVLSNAMKTQGQTPEAIDEAVANVVFSNQFRQFAKALDKADIIENTKKLLSNYTSIEDMIKANISFTRTFDFTSLPENLSQVGGLTAIQNLNVSMLCLSDILQIAIGLGSQNRWAMQMLDASARIPTELLNYNLDWRGSFDECVAVKRENFDVTFDSQYCTGFISINSSIAIALGPLGSLRFGLCIPESCSTSDIKTLLNLLLSSVPVDVPEVSNVVCQDNNPKYDDRAIAMLAVCATFLVLMITATFYDVTMVQIPKKKKKQDTGSAIATKSNGTQMADVIIENGKPSLDNIQEHDKEVFDSSEEKYKIEDEKRNVDVKSAEPQKVEYQPGTLGKLLLSFSVYSNGKKLLNTKQASGSLTALNGIRFLSMSWVILGHTYALGNSNIINMKPFTETMYKRVSFFAILNATVSVDSFFALSGLLLTYLIMKQMKKNKGKGGWPRFWFMFYFHRFWRLTPPYMLLLGCYVSLYLYLSNGPTYPQEAGLMSDAKFCEDNWWTNLLYVNNIVKPEEMCFGWSWYLANDMQFYVVSPIMLIPLFFFPVGGLIITCLALLATVTTAGVLGKINQWPPTVFGGGEHPVGTEGLDYYIKPWCRMGPYIVGMLTGYVLYRTKCKVKINRYVNFLCWVVAALLACLVLYGVYRPINGHPMHDDESALYLATHRTVWGACVCWVIFACATGNGGYINTLLSWGAFVPLARLTYCAYLVHPIIIIVYASSLRISQYWTDFTIIYLFLGHLSSSYFVSFVVSLAFESPMMGLEKVLLGGKTKKK